MKKIFKYFAYSVAAFSLSSGIISCSDNEPDYPYPYVNKGRTAKSTVLIYAVATNSLEWNLVQDKNEMIQAASQIDLEENNVLLFQTVYTYLPDNTKSSAVTLNRLMKVGNGYEWMEVREFDREEMASLDPRRISEVVDFVEYFYPAQNYGMVFWSHSTASQPFTRSGETVEMPMQYSFGQDKTTLFPEYEQINIDELANALPDGFLDYIWFDSCYMSNIETIYQFRNKCKTFVGYPTEVLDKGLPYDLVLPYMVGEKPDLVGAAKLFYYNYSDTFGTIAVTDMSKIEVLADFCKENFIKGKNVSSSHLVKYSRSSTGPFYDLEDYIKEITATEKIPLSREEIKNVFNIFIEYKATTSGGYLGLSINPETYSGISTHNYSFKEEGDEYDSSNEKFYKSLDWYKRVFED